MKIDIIGYDDLTFTEKNLVSDNGVGKIMANYLKVTHNDEVILLESDAMEKEDVCFTRDLSWIPEIIKRAYELGRNEK